MDNTFDDDEKLFRAVFPPTKFPNFGKKNGQISSAALKDKKGLSVERDNHRSRDEVISYMKDVFEGCIISVTAKQCKDVKACIKYCPTARSKYHSEIHGASDRVILDSGQAKRLARQAVIEYKE